MSSGKNHLRLEHEGRHVVATMTIPGEPTGRYSFAGDEYEPDTEKAVLLFPDRCRELALILLENNVKPGALSVIRDLIRENKVDK